MYTALLIQCACVTAVAVAFRRQVHPELNLLVAAMFVTTPIYSFGPLGSEGLLFLLDLVAPVLLLGQLLRSDWAVGKLAGRFALVILVLPLIYAPLSLLMVSSDYVPFHTFLLSSLLIRSAWLVAVLTIIERHLQPAQINNMVRLFCVHMAVLMALGLAQYFLAVDLVVFERIRGVEETAEYFLDPDRGIFYGLGFLGLFRGAVAQMAALAVFWGIWTAMLFDSKRPMVLLAYLLPALAMGCVVGSLSRAGLAAVLVALASTFFIHHQIRRMAVLYLASALLIVYYFDVYYSIGDLGSIIAGRFDILDLSAQRGSGITRLEAISAYADHLTSDWQPWLIGVGGFNPIELHRQYGVFGMHNGYADLLVRYGLFVGTAVLGLLAAGAVYMLRGLASKNRVKRSAAKAFVPLLLGVLVISLSQESLTFYGSAGYLAAVHLWVALLIVATVRGREIGGHRASQRRIFAGYSKLDCRYQG